MAQLTQLDLSNNLFTAFPVALLKLDALLELALSGNKLVRLPKSVPPHTWPRVRALALTNCALTKVASWICTLPALESLDISRNELVCLPAALCDADKLTDLRCDNNPLLWPSLQAMSPGASNTNEALSSLLRAAVARSAELPTVRIAVIGPAQQRQDVARRRPLARRRA